MNSEVCCAYWVLVREFSPLIPPITLSAERFQNVGGGVSYAANSFKQFLGHFVFRSQKAHVFMGGAGINFAKKLLYLHRPNTKNGKRNGQNDLKKS